MFITVRLMITMTCPRPITPKISQRRLPRPPLTVVASDMRLTTSSSVVTDAASLQLPRAAIAPSPGGR